MNQSQERRIFRAIVLIGVYGGLLMPLVFIPVVIFPFVFSKLIFFQVLIGLTFPAYLILAWIDSTTRPRWTLLYSAIFAYFVALALSVTFAVDPARAWWGNQERMNGLFTVLHFFVWLTMAISVVKTWEQWKKLLWYQLVLSGMMSIVALLQRPFPNLLLFPASGRVGGLLDNPIYMGAYQIFNLFFIALLWLRGSDRTSRIWLTLFALLDIAAFIGAFSRGPLLGLGVGILVFAALYGLLVPSRKSRMIVLSATAILFISYGALFAFRNTDVIKNSPFGRFTNFQTTTRTRLIAWEIAWKGFLERPLTGWGYDNFHILFNVQYNPESLHFGYYETWFDRAHNTVMDALAMTGIFGTVTFFGIFGALFYSVHRAYRKKWIDRPMTCIFVALPIAYFIQNLLVFDQPAGFSMSFLLYALIARATSGEFPWTEHAQATVKSDTIPSKQVPWIAFVILQALAIFLVWRTSLIPFQASRNTITSNNYFSAGLIPQALEFAKKAASLPTMYLDEQTFLQSRNSTTLVDNGMVQKFPAWREWHDLVRSVTERYFQDHPKNAHSHFIYARFLETYGRIIPEDIPLAEKEYLKAIEWSPKRQQLHYNLGRFYLERGKSQEAIEVFRRTVEFDPEVGESHWYLGLTLFYNLNQREEGAKEIAKAMSAKSPYQLKDFRDGVTVATAYDLLKDKEHFRDLLMQMQSLSGGSLPFFLEIAHIAERLGLMPERNVVLNAILRADPTFKARIAPLLETKTAKTIEEALKQTSVKPAETPRPAAAAVNAAVAATTSGSGSGPRRR